MLREVGAGPEVLRCPAPASWRRTFIMSMGWITVVAVMPVEGLVGVVVEGGMGKVEGGKERTCQTAVDEWKSSSDGGSV